MRFKNNEHRVVENIDLRIRTAQDIANTGPAQPIHDGHHCLHEERVELEPKETQPLVVTMPAFRTAVAEGAGFEVFKTKRTIGNNLKTRCL